MSEDANRVDVPMLKNLLILILALLLAGSLWLLFGGDPEPAAVVAVPADDPLSEIIGKMEAELGSVAVGFCVLDEEGKVVAGYAEETPMIPASTFKTLTTVAALDLLGPDFRFVTELRSDPPVGGRIGGDLVIRGGGDPMLGMADLEAMADALKSRGITGIDGGVVGDGSLFPENMAGDFWGWGDVGNGYGSPTSGLNLEHNRFVAEFQGGRNPGDEARFVGARPEVPGVEWLNRVRTGEEGSGDGVVVYGGPLAGRLLLTGTVPPAVRFGVRGAVPDPPAFAAHHFDRLLRERGVGVGKKPSVARTGRPGGELLLKHESPALAEILPGLHGRSDNHETECLFRMIGLKTGQSAEVALADYWRARGVDGLRVVDGSGLSRADFISARGLATVQWVAARAETASLYRDSLSPSHDGAVRSKVGGMSAVRGWTGYAGGRSFAVIFNHYGGDVRPEVWRDELLKAVLEDR